MVFNLKYIIKRNTQRCSKRRRKKPEKPRAQAYYSDRSLQVEDDDPQKDKDDKLQHLFYGDDFGEDLGAGEH